MGSQGVPPGVVELDHTADVGMTVEADSLEELFHRAAEGMLWLMWEQRITGDPVSAPRRVALESDVADTLLV
ncbi:MAG: archease, partial [Gemmatimonadota bacterium]